MIKSIKIMGKTKIHKKHYVEKNPVENPQDILTGVAKSTSDIVKSVAGDFWSQFVDTPRPNEEQKSQQHGDLQEGEELILNKTIQNRIAQEEKKLSDIEPGIDYVREVRNGTEVEQHKENQQIGVKIQEIMAELKRLTSSSRELQNEFKEVSVEQRAVKPGKYHESFFEWVLSTIRQARIKVEDSASWLALFKSKKSKREYWGMAKKHGTSFSLSNERVVATQVG